MIAQAECSPANIKRYFATVRHDSIHGFPYNYRKDFGSQGMLDLEESIRQQGIIEPLILHKAEAVNGINAGYIGIAGERRHRAAGSAGLDEVPAIIFEGISRRAAIEIALVENLQRKDVNPIEEATGYRMLKEEVGMKQAEIAERVGRPRSSVANTVRLLNLPESVQEHLAAGRLTKAHGVALLRFSGHDEVIEFIAAKAIKEGTPAGVLEKGLPFYNDLHHAKLAYRLWPYEIHGGYTEGAKARERVIEDNKKADSGKGWYQAGEATCVIPYSRGEAINDLMQKAYNKSFEKSEDDDGGYVETEEQKLAREEREKEASMREIRHQDLLSRLNRLISEQMKRVQLFPEQTCLEEWDGIIKTVLAGAYMFENVEDTDLPLFFPEGTRFPDDDYEELEQMILSLPIHKVLRLAMVPLVRRWEGGQAWNAELETAVKLMEGKK